MKIATYNVNSIKARGANLCKWLQTSQPDIVFLQEIKCETEIFYILNAKVWAIRLPRSDKKAITALPF